MKEVFLQVSTILGAFVLLALLCVSTAFILSIILFLIRRQKWYAFEYPFDFKGHHVTVYAVLYHRGNKFDRLVFYIKSQSRVYRRLSSICCSDKDAYYEIRNVVFNLNDLFNTNFNVPYVDTWTEDNGFHYERTRFTLKD